MITTRVDLTEHRYFVEKMEIKSNKIFLKSQQTLYYPEFYGDIYDNPLFTGNYKDRRTNKHILEGFISMELSEKYCLMCGKETNIFDNTFFIGDKYRIPHLCKKCKETEYKKPLKTFLSYFLVDSSYL